MGATRRLLVTVAEGAVVLTLASWALVLIPWPHVSLRGATVAILTAVVVPDVLAAWWIFRRLRTERPRNDARRAATAFAVSAPVVLGVGNALGEIVGGYAEALLGSRFILPSIGAFVIILMIFIPSGVVIWALHPSGGVGPVPESDHNEHC